MTLAVKVALNPNTTNQLYCLQGKCTVMNCGIQVNPLPGEKILDWSKLKQIADNILKCTQNEK